MIILTSTLEGCATCDDRDGPSCSPQILIADEPTTALDVTIQAQIIDLVKRLRDELGMAIIWITHDLGVVASLAQRVLVMYGGFIIEEVTRQRICMPIRHPYTIGLLGSLPRVDEKERTKLVFHRRSAPCSLSETQCAVLLPALQMGDGALLEGKSAAFDCYTVVCADYLGETI